MTQLTRRANSRRRTAGAATRAGTGPASRFPTAFRRSAAAAPRGRAATGLARPRAGRRDTADRRILRMIIFDRGRRSARSPARKRGGLGSSLERATSGMASRSRFGQRSQRRGSGVARLAGPIVARAGQARAGKRPLALALAAVGATGVAFARRRRSAPASEPSGEQATSAEAVGPGPASDADTGHASDADTGLASDADTGLASDVDPLGRREADSISPASR